MTTPGAKGSDTSVYRDVVSAFASVKRLHQRGKRQMQLASAHNPRRESVVMVIDFADRTRLEVELLDGKAGSSARS